MSGSWVGVRLFNENVTVIQKKPNLNKHNQLDTMARWLAWNYFSTDNQIIISSTPSVNITLLKWDNKFIAFENIYSWHKQKQFEKQL